MSRNTKADQRNNAYITDVQHLLTCFYHSRDLIAARNPTVLQQAFDVLTNTWNYVGQRTNTTKAETMVSPPWKIRTHPTLEAHKTTLDNLYQDK